MKNKKIYSCIRCGYETEYKSSMFNHFYKKKKPCPTLSNEIELTPEIKQKILDNYFYRIPVAAIVPNQTQEITKIINNYHTVNNFIAGLDTMDKLSKYTEYKNMNIIDLEENIETKYEKRAQKLDDDGFKGGFKLSGDDFLDIINEVSNALNNLEHLNILYDNKDNTLKLYEGGIWAEYTTVMNGIKKIIITIQSYYLSSYELYLIRIIYNPKYGCYKKQECRELLMDYYKFIGCFDVSSCTKGMSDGDIIKGESDSTYEIEDRYEKIYKEAIKSLKTSEINRTKRDVFDILKRNSIKNVAEMNKKVIELFKVDEGFKKTLIDDA